MSGNLILTYRISCLSYMVDRRLTSELGCPALDGVYLSEGKDIQKLLCTPSPHRLDIVEWICISVYPALREQFSSLKESQSDLKIEGMAKLGYDLMLCQADDLDLIKGKVCAQKQLHFLEQLLVVIPPQGNFTVSNSISDSSTFSSTEESFQEIAKKNEEFVKQVFSSSNLQAVLNPESHPWSSDIKALLLNEEVQQKRSLLSVTSHEETLLEALKELEEMVAALQELRTEVYESELQKHCEHPAPVLSCCDPLFQAVHLSLLLCVQELQGLTQVTKTSECIVKTVKRQHGEKGVWSGSTRATLPSKLKELQQKYEAIHAALKDCQQS
ncbi:HAUS augmin-like complex subunit 7 isoform X3 [Rhineura floridana]|uniref:HAUS augmin-like complex subunit 7 isoform X3 n=1 Tax=Rhineura floridana TaxID=261503 RepID=UPI002AC88B71|nr:HAUS augmin-like complex subunit 7 isoform X3 [Rhineura floridana]